MALDTLWTAIEQIPIAREIRATGQLFPWIESVHVLAICLVVGSIGIMDLRLLGLKSVDKPVSRISQQVLPLTWGAFALAVVTGSLLFASSATTYAGNWPFRFKMICLALAGLNMLLFHTTTWRSAMVWDTHRQPPAAAKIQAGISLGFWFCIIAFGRWIGFTAN
ncbi:MAG: DUF6644 family protein [Caulobacteraceae bacterium]